MKLPFYRDDRDGDGADDGSDAAADDDDEDDGCDGDHCYFYC